MATLTAAREAWRVSAHEQEGPWSDVENRRKRYAFLWQYYENQLYVDMQSHRAAHGLYRHIRGIYNPVARLTDFYVAKIWGGNLDFETLSGAIPIETNNEALRGPIADIWRWSNWAAKKTIATRWGACLGDMVIKVVDRAETKKQVYFQVMHPRMIKDALFDHRGYVQSCVIEYIDSEPTGEEGVYRDFTFKETITKEKFATFKDDEPFDYRTYNEGDEIVGPTWENPYGFVPLVISNHKDVGLDWGQCCFAGGIEKIDELNDQASIFDDRLRQANNPNWFVAGAGAGDIDLSSDDATTTDQFRRQTMNILFGPEGAKLQAFLNDSGMDQTLDNIGELLKELERDFPELALHRMRESDMSGRALRIVFQDISDRVIEARGNYDSALVRLLQMAISIGGDGGLFSGFNLESYAAGNEELRIGDRPVLTEAVDLEALKLASETGVPGRHIWAKLNLGWTDKEMGDMEKEAAGAEGGSGGWHISEQELQQAQADLDALTKGAGGGEPKQ